jgi:hypothetical protein
LLAGVVLLSLTRFGLLATTSLFATQNALDYCITENLFAWYGAGTILAVLWVLAIAGYGFHTSFAGRPVFGEGCCRSDLRFRPGLFDGENVRAYSRRMTARRIWIARVLAVTADVIQIGLAPLFLEGGLSAFDAVLDVLMAGHDSARRVALGVSTGVPRRVNPGIDLVPSWTLAVFLATRRRTEPGVAPRDDRVIAVEPVRERSRNGS